MKAKSIFRIIALALFALAAVQAYQTAHAGKAQPQTVLACSECGV